MNYYRGKTQTLSLSLSLSCLKVLFSDFIIADFIIVVGFAAFFSVLGSIYSGVRYYQMVL